MRNVVIALFTVCIFFVNSVYSQDCEYVHKGIKYYEKQVYSDKSEQNICNYYNLAQEYLRENKVQKALNTYADIIEINNQEEEAYIRRALIYQLYEYFKLSEMEYANLLKNMPNSSKANSGIATVYTDILDFDNALKHINIAIKNDTENDDYLYVQRALILQKMGNYSEAIKDYTKFINSNGFNNYYYAYENRGLCYEKLGMEAEAKNDMEIFKTNNKEPKINNFKIFIFKYFSLGLQRYLHPLY